MEISIITGSGWCRAANSMAARPFFAIAETVMPFFQEEFSNLPL